MALDSFPFVNASSPVGFESSIVVRYADRPHDPFRLRPGEVDGQQPVLQIRTENLHAFRQHERALELARRDSAVKKLPGLVILLASADDELAFLHRNIDLVAGETGDRERNTQTLWLAVFARNPLDII